MKDILQTLDQSDTGLSKNEVLSQVNGSDKKIEAALKYLTAEFPAPVVVAQQNPIKYARTLNSYQLPREEIERLSKIKKDEWEVMKEYQRHNDCLMLYLSKELNDHNNDPCGRCANCNPDGALSDKYSHKIGEAAAAFLENILIEIEPRKVVSCSDFPVENFPRKLINENLMHESGRALSYWGDAGWGEVAKKGKASGSFHPGLAKASAKLIRERWMPDPAPQWLTYVPSMRNNALVADFAKQLADLLGIPCFEVVKKVRKNKPQKLMDNSRFRCANLDGVFKIESNILDTPVLLVDDAVDSSWTFTVVSALLRRAGSGPVYPFAVVSTANT